MEKCLYLGFYLINEYQDPFFHYSTCNRILILLFLSKLISEHLRDIQKQLKERNRTMKECRCYTTKLSKRYVCCL